MEILKNIMAETELVMGVGLKFLWKVFWVLEILLESLKSIEKSSGKIKELKWRCWKFFWKAPSVL